MFREREREEREERERREERVHSYSVLFNRG